MISKPLWPTFSTCLVGMICYILSTTDLAVNITSLCFHAAYILGIRKSHLRGKEGNVGFFYPVIEAKLEAGTGPQTGTRTNWKLYSSAEVGPSGSFTEWIFSTRDSTTPSINNYALWCTHGWGSWAVQPVLGSKHVRYEQDLTPLSQLCLNCSAVSPSAKVSPISAQPGLLLQYWGLQSQIKNVTLHHAS